MKTNLAQTPQHRKWMMYIGLFLFFLLWQWNGCVTGLITGYDWGVANVELLATTSDQLHYGKDVFLLGHPPLSWLFLGVIPALTGGYGEAIFQSFTINIVSALLRVAVIALFWGAARDKRSKAIAAVVSVFVFLRFSISSVLPSGVLPSGSTDLCVLVVSIMICKLLFFLSSGKIMSGRFHVWTAAYVMAISILLSVPQLMKFSYITIAAVLLIITAIILLVHKRYTEVALLFMCYIASTCLLWTLSGEQLRYLLPYVRSMLQFVGGYSEVFSLQFSASENAFRDFLFALAICAGYGVMFLYLLVRDRLKAVAWFIIAPFLFLSFKEAFVRSDGHTAYFFNALYYLVCYLLFVFIMNRSEAEKDIHTLFSVGEKICCILLVLFLIPDIVNRVWYPSSTIYSDINSIFTSEKYEETVVKSKDWARALPEYQTLFQDIKPYPDSTLGMLSGEQTFFIAYDLIDRFKPNPIVSQWGNTNSYTEMLTIEHYYGNDAPEVLLYRPEPLDNGYFIFRMGKVLQPLLENYHVENLDDYGYLVLRRNEQDKSETVMLGEPMKVSVGTPIDIPTAENAFVFMKIDWNLTPLGRLASFVLKPPQTMVTIRTENEATYEYRFLRTLATNGLYVSNHIITSQDLAELINGNLNYNLIENITIEGPTLFYEEDFEVSFYAVPFTQEQAAYQGNRSNVTVKFASELPTGDYQFFYAQDGAFTEKQSVRFSIGNERTELTEYIPSDGWNTLRLDFPSQIDTYDILSITCDSKNAVIDGANDVQYIQTENGWHITAGDQDPYIIFHLLE